MDMERKDVDIRVIDEAYNCVVSITLHQRNNEEIENAIASLQATFLFCMVETIGYE